MKLGCMNRCRMPPDRAIAPKTHFAVFPRQRLNPAGPETLTHKSIWQSDRGDQITQAVRRCEDAISDSFRQLRSRDLTCSFRSVPSVMAPKMAAMSLADRATV